MYNSTLTRRTPLKAKTSLKAKSTLRPKTDLRSSYAQKVKSGAKQPKRGKNKPYKPRYKYHSIFTKDLERCYITGTRKSGVNVHIHHIFGGAKKAASEKYGFLVPLRMDWHDMSDYAVHFNKELDLRFKEDCEHFFLENVGSKEDFINEFGMWCEGEDTRSLSEIVSEAQRMYADAA